MKNNAIERIIHPENQENREVLKKMGLEHGKKFLQSNIAPKWHKFFESNINSKS